MIPLVTVLLPAYNAERFIYDSVMSVRHQTFRDWTLLVLDDGSTDDTLEIAQEACGDDPRCVILSQEHRGMTSTLRTAVEGAKSPWVFRLDADDYMMPSRLEHQVRVASRGHYSVLGSGTLEFNNGTKQTTVRKYPTTNEECRAMLSGWRPRSPFAHSAVMMNRHAVIAAGNYRPRWGLCQDLALWLEMARQPGRLGNLPTPLTLRNIHAAQVSNRKWRRRFDYAGIVLSHKIGL